MMFKLAEMHTFQKDVVSLYIDWTRSMNSVNADVTNAQIPLEYDTKKTTKQDVLIDN